MFLRLVIFIVTAFTLFSTTYAQYEDQRCMCVCPQPSEVNRSKSNGMVFNYPVPKEHCNCEYVVLPKLGVDIKGRENEFCPRCECKYESRNTTTIKVVVILVTWVISLLVVYMGFLLCLEPLLNKRRNAAALYQHQTNEDDLPADQDGPEPPHPLRPRPHDVLGRVGHHQDRWKRQVSEQRRNIYDRHTMLN